MKRKFSLRRTHYVLGLLCSLFLCSTSGYAQVAPVANCQSATVEMGPAGVAEVLPSDIDNGSWAPMGGIQTMTINGQSSVYFGCNDLGTQSVTLTVTDSLGNTANCMSTVSIIDTLNYCSTNPTSITGIHIDTSWVTQCNVPQCDGMLTASGYETTSGFAPFSSQATFTWSNGATTPTIQGLCAGWYFLTVTEPNGTMHTDSIELFCSSSLFQVSVYGQDATNCTPNFCDGRANVAVTGGIAPYTFTWSQGDTRQNLTDLCPGTYTVTVTDNNGAQIIRNVTIGCNVQPQAVCQSLVRAQLDATGNVTIPATLFDGGSVIPAGYKLLIDGRSELTLNCNHLGRSYHVLIVTDSLGNNSTCATYVELSDPLGACQIAGAYLDVQTVNPTNCTGACTGQATVTVVDSINVLTPPFQYFWTDGDTSAVRNDLCVTTGGAPYTVTVVDANNQQLTAQVNILCDSLSTTPIQVQVVTMADSCHTTACDGAVELLISGGSAPYHVAWLDTIFVGTTLNNLCAGNYPFTITDANGLVQHGVAAVGTSTGCVWPGDTDDNSQVNFYDLLPLGLAYGESGPARTNATINWTPQQATDWTTANPVPGLPNYKHIDANGDGLINLTDVLALTQNYGQSYFRGGSSLSGSTPIFVEDANAVQGGNLSLPIHLGEAGQVAQDVYGIAFSLYFDPQVVEAGSVNVSFGNSWLGTLNADMITIQHVDRAAGRVDVAMTRINRTHISNYGRIASLNMTIRDDVLRRAPSKQTEVSVRNVRLIDSRNTPKGVAPKVGTIRVDPVSTTSVPTAENLQLFPNPTAGELQLQAESRIEQVRLFSINGQLLQTWMPQNVQTQLSIESFSQGLYILEIQTEKATHHKRVRVQR